MEEKIGTCEQCKNSCVVYFGPDPFSEEINGDDTPYWICDDCRHQIQVEC